jgi:hypothetical protein
LLAIAQCVPTVDVEGSERKGPSELPSALPSDRRHVREITQMNYDGLWPPSKPLRDALVRARVIQNDSPEDIPRPELRQMKVRHLRDEHVEILIEAVGQSQT